MKNFCYEFKNSLKNRYALIISVVLVSTFVVYSIHVGEEYAASQPVSLETYGYGINQDGNLTASILVISQYGMPVAGSLVNVKIAHSLNLSGITNRAGFYNFTIEENSTFLNSSLYNGTGDYYEVTYSGQEVHGILEVYTQPINSYFYGKTANNTSIQVSPRFRLIPVYLKQDATRIGVEIIHFSLRDNPTPPVYLYYHTGKLPVRDSPGENNSAPPNASDEKFIGKVYVNTVLILPLSNLSI